MPKLNLTPEQIEMLRKGYRRAQEIPQGFDMRDWVSLSSAAPCGTACCYAGELCIANGRFEPRELLRLFSRGAFSVSAEATDLLSLPYRSLMPLFFVDRWPDELRKKHEAANIPSVRAEALAEVVEMFIAADGDVSDW